MRAEGSAAKNERFFTLKKGQIMKRSLSAFLLLMMILSASACSETTVDTDADTRPVQSDAAGDEPAADPEETAPSRIRKDFEIKDMGGKSFHVFRITLFAPFMLSQLPKPSSRYQG